EPLRLDVRSSGDQQQNDIALPAMVSGGRVLPAMNGPAERRRLIFLILEVQIRSGDQFRYQTLLAQHRSPMECRLSEQAPQIRRRSCLYEPNAHVLSS